MTGSLAELIALLESEVERLKVDLETFRLSAHPQREALLRDLVAAIDERQDRLEELRAIAQAMASDSSAPEIH